MTNRFVAVVYSAIALVAAVAVAAWLLVSGNISGIHGLMLVKAGLLAAVIFAFRLIELSIPSVNSLWGSAGTYLGDRK
jgi:hypothetical protein